MPAAIATDSADPLPESARPAAAAPPAVFPASAVQPSVGVTPGGAPPPANAQRPASASPLQLFAPMALDDRRVVPPVSPLTTATAVGLGLTNVIQFAVLLTVSALSATPPGPFTQTPTLRLNGFDIVPTSTEEVTSMYGRWAYLPGTPGLIQGRQTFGVVDPETGDRLGAFHALVSRGNGLGYTQLLVTSHEPVGVDTAAGPVPPVGSLITNLQLGPIGFAYSALPTPSGNAVSFTVTTPFGDLRVPLPFDNAKGIGDRTVDNRPMRLGNGYSIAPADPDGETFTGASGILPGFMTVQGHQVFGVFDPNGHQVGSFDGIFTTTADIFFYTQAVMVTGNDGGNVGSGPGQVPPVGSVFNVVYFGTDDNFLVYASSPGPAGPRTSVIRTSGGKSTASAVTLVDATPPVVTLSGPGGTTFIPVSELRPTGVNGLPPREVEIQGYQQFDVHDRAGRRIGTVDADVFNQWDAFGMLSTALLVTRVADGGDDVPPVGSIFNFVNSVRTGFGTAQSTVPGPSGNVTSFGFRTPWGDVPFPSVFVPVASRTDVSFYSPFASR